jgi:hypothetical protein
MSESQSQSGSVRQPRLSFTRKHTDSGIVAELLMLLETVTNDGTITDNEAHEIAEWLEANRAESSIPGIEFLRTTVREILADGKVSTEERTALYKAVERVLPLEARRGARERRTALDVLGKARARSHREAERQRAREERERNRPVIGANFMVAGVLYANRGNVVEQFAAEGQRVFLVREPHNPHDSNAILVRLDRGYDIGYVPRHEAAALAKFLDLGFPHSAAISKILQGRRAPIPVVDADIFAKDAEVKKFFPNDVPQSAKPPQGGCLTLLLFLAFVPFALVLLAISSPFY